MGTVLLSALLALALIGALAPALGWRADVVRSGSMSPAIGVGDLAVTSPVSSEDLRVGDVVCYHLADGSLVCHRTIAIDASTATLLTKGDANEDADPYPVPFDDVVGRITFTVPLLGYVISFLQGPFGWATMVLLGLLTIFSGKDSPARQENRPEEGGK